MLIGFSKDIHKLERNKKRNLVLGGFVINDSKYKIKSHSDGDIIFHAIADAIYSVVGNTDIGQYFSDLGIENKNLNSKLILVHALELLNKFKFNNISNVNLTIISNHIIISKYKEEIISSIQKLIPNTTINLKGRRFEKRNKTIECYCSLIIY